MGEKPNRAVIFDLDGVLVDSTALVERAWRWWAEEQGIAFGEVRAIAHGRPARDVVREVAPHLDSAQEARRLDGWEEEHSAGLAALPGALDCVVAAARGPWGVVTSGNRSLARGRLLAAGLPTPPVLVTADDVEHGKPHPEPYRQAGLALRVPARSCMVVEDAPAGIAAAKEAGMTVIAVSTTHRAAALGVADVICGSMREIHEVLISGSDTQRQH
jgi:sugar-phosphatase